MLKAVVRIRKDSKVLVFICISAGNCGNDGTDLTTSISVLRTYLVQQNEVAKQVGSTNGEEVMV